MNKGMQKSEFIHLSRVREKPAQKKNYTGPWKMGDNGATLSWDPGSYGKYQHTVSE